MNTVILVGSLIGGGLVLMIGLDLTLTFLERLYDRTTRRLIAADVAVEVAAGRHRMMVADLVEAEAALDSLERCGLRGEVHTRPAGFEIVWTGTLAHRQTESNAPGGWDHGGD